MFPKIEKPGFISNQPNVKDVKCQNFKKDQIIKKKVKTLPLEKKSSISVLMV